MFLHSRLPEQRQHLELKSKLDLVKRSLPELRQQVRARVLHLVPVEAPLSASSLARLLVLCKSSLGAVEDKTTLVLRPPESWLRTLSLEQRRW